MTQDYLEAKLQEIRELAYKYAGAKAQRIYLEEFRKSKKSLLMKAAEVEGIKTAALQEREAYANSEYVELLQGLQTAVEMETSLQWELKLREWKFEAWRTKSANSRAERNRYGA